jgi:hypothetical protein
LSNTSELPPRSVRSLLWVHASGDETLRQQAEVFLDFLVELPVELAPAKRCPDP